MRIAPKRLSLALLIVAILSAACSTAPDGVTPVDNFELDRYLGTWYEIARLDHRFERGMSSVTASYSLRDDGGVAVVNRGFLDDRGEWDSATGKAYFVGPSDVGQFKVSFFGPFYSGYNVIALDRDDYQYAMIAGSGRKYLWILARTPELDPQILKQLVATADELEFPVDELIYVPHPVARR